MQRQRRVRSDGQGLAGQGDSHGDNEVHEEAIGHRWPWLLPVAAGIFLGAVVFEVFPEALARAGSIAWLWVVIGLALFIFVRDGLDYAGRHGMAAAATLGIWIHSFLEGAITASGYGVSLVVGLITSIGLILHLIPEVGAVIVLLLAAGLSLRQALIRNGITWVMIVVGFLVVYFLLPELPSSVLGAALAFGAGGFLYLAYLSWHEHRWATGPSLAAAVVGLVVVGAIRLATG